MTYRLDLGDMGDVGDMRMAIFHLFHRQKMYFEKGFILKELVVPGETFSSSRLSYGSVWTPCLTYELCVRGCI